MTSATMDYAAFDRMLVINALGVIDNPNTVDPAAGANRQTLAYSSTAARVDARAMRDAKEAHLSAVNVTLGHVAGSSDPFEATVRDIARWDVHIRAHPLALRKVLDGTDLTAAHAAGQVGVIYGFQNTEMLGRDASRVQVFAQLGVRIIQLTYNGRNAVGDGSTYPDDQGLSAFGGEVVAALQAHNILVDLSHSSRKTCLDALRLAQGPIVISHSACRALADHPRNKSDEELRLLADGGGVIGIYSMPYLRLSGQPMAADLLAHLEHAINVCGEDHVGIGTDNGITLHDDPEALRRAHRAEVEMRRQMGIGAPGESADVMLGLPDLEGVSQFRQLAAMLSARGHSEARIAKILGGNFQRVMTQAWAK